MTARKTTGSQSGLTKHHVDRIGHVDLSNTYRVIVLVMGLGLGLSLWGSTVGQPSNSWASCFNNFAKVTGKKVVSYLMKNSPETFSVMTS